MWQFLETSLPATKSSRANAVHYTPTGPDRGTAIIDQKGKGHIGEYRVEEFACDGGRGFTLRKLAGGSDPTTESYDVFLPFEETADAGFAWETCDCHGFERFGHCKHVDAIRAIVDRGLIALPIAPPAPVRIPLTNRFAAGEI